MNRQTSEMRNETIHVVIAGGIVFDAYRHADSAELHARVLTGGKAVSCMLRDSVPPEILEDIQSDFDRDNDDETPVDAPVPSRAARDTDPRFDTSDIDNGYIRRR